MAVMKVMVAVAIAVAVPASAQRADEAVPGVVGAVAKCRAITDPGARLACFDNASAALDTAVREKQVTVLDAEGVKRTKRSLFGFTLPSFGLFGDRKDEPGQPAEVTEVNAVIRSVQAAGNGRYELLLDDGARWQTTDPLAFAPTAGSKVRIRKAALGSYFIKVNNERSIKGRRVG